MGPVWINMRRMHAIKACRPKVASYILTQDELAELTEKAWYEGFNTAYAVHQKRAAAKRKRNRSVYSPPENTK